MPRPITKTEAQANRELLRWGMRWSMILAAIALVGAVTIMAALPFHR